jgi:DNA adenine methylase
MGSKSRISKEIVPIIQKCIDDNCLETYIESCVGGANVIDKIKCKTRIGNDSNEYLIDFWNAMQNGLNLNSISMDKDTYIDIRDNKEKYPKYMVAIAGILASYNSKWFAGYAKTHIAKAPSDKNVVVRNYYKESINNVLKQIPNLKDVNFICGDFTSIDVTNAMIYCDPPYENTTGFKDKFDHKKYWDWVRKVSINNFVLCSEYQAPDDFIEIWSGEVKITLDNASRSKSIEKLFTYKNGKYVEYIDKGK